MNWLTKAINFGEKIKNNRFWPKFLNCWPKFGILAKKSRILVKFRDLLAQKSSILRILGGGFPEAPRRATYYACLPAGPQSGTRTEARRCNSSRPGFEIDRGRSFAVGRNLVVSPPTPAVWYRGGDL